MTKLNSGYDYFWLLLTLLHPNKRFKASIIDITNEHMIWAIDYNNVFVAFA